MVVNQKKLEKLNNIPTIRDFGSHLMDKVLRKELDLTDKTISQYMSETELFIRQLGIGYDQKPTKQQALVWAKEAEGRYARKTRGKKLAAINHFLEFCGYDWRLPMTKSITRCKEPTILSEGEIYKLIALAEQEGKHTKALLMLVGFELASRVTALLNIKISNIDFETNRILLEKDKQDRDRIVPMSKKAMDKVRAYIDLHRPEPRSAEDENFLFIQEIKRNRANGPYLRYSMHQYALKLGIEKSVHPHTLRHSRIKWLRQKNFSWEKILSLTGHASLMSLSDYIQGEELDKLQIALDELEDPTETQTPQSPQELRAALLEKENERLKLELEVLKFQIQGQEVSKPDQKTRMNNIGYI